MSEKTPSENFTDEGYAAFEAAWLARRDGDPPPNWQRYLPGPNEPCSSGLIVMLLKADIECRIKAGLPALLNERYFEHPRFQQLDARLDAEQQMELIRWEYELRARNGQPLRPVEYEAAFPQLAEAIRQLKSLSRSPQSDPDITQDESLQPSSRPTSEGEPPPFSMSAPLVAEDNSLGLDLRDYELIEQLGQGGMGEVYRCCDPALSRDLAIKVMKGELCKHADVEQRFVREARITGSLQHPGIIAVHNLGRLADGRLFYTMRMLRDGRTFADILKEESGKAERLPSLLAIFEKVCEAVAYAHSKHVIHRDLKPANIMVGKFGEVQVMDWGLAKLLTAEDETREEQPRREASGTLIHTEAKDTPSDLTQAGAGVGTPAYMPPEQAQGDWPLVDERADVFALGAILCVMLTGQPPYRGGDADDLLRRARRGDLAEALARLEQCGADRALTDLCRECLSVEPQRRPRDAGVVARCVADYQIAVETRLRQAELERTEAEVKSREERKRRRLAVMLSTAVLLVLVAGIMASSWFALDARHQAGLAREHEQQADDNAKLEKQARHSAEDQKTRAEIARRDAENEKTRADQEAEDARQQKRHAEAARDRAEWLLYVNQIRLAQHQWQDGNVQHARDLLAACRWDFRGWEYSYLRHLCDDTQQTFRGHYGEVFSVCFSPDGKRLASGGIDHTVKVWNTATGQELLTLKGHTGAVLSVCFSPDGKRLASGSHDATVKVWDVVTGQVLLTVKGHNSLVDSVCFSPDGKRLASGSRDQTVKVWDAAGGQEVFTLKGHTGFVLSVCFSPDGKRLASGSWDRTVKVWNVVTGQELLTLIGHNSLVDSVCFSPDGKRLASGSRDQTVKVWDAATGRELLRLIGHNKGVLGVCFSPDGKRLASGSWDYSVKVWNTATGQEFLTLKGHTQPVYSICFSPDGKRLASASREQTVKVWDVVTGQEFLILKGHNSGVSSVCFSPDGKRMASGSLDRTVKVWDVVTGQEFLTLKGHYNGVLSVCFSPDGKHLASASLDQTVKVWDVVTGQEFLILKGHNSVVSSVCFSPDGKRLASASWDRTVKVWNVATGQELLTLKGHTVHVESVCFSPDGKLLASASRDRTVKVWNAVTGQELLTLIGHNGPPVDSVCFSPDGKLLASASRDRTVKVWNAATGQELLTLKGHTDEVYSVCFSPDGKLLASASRDQTVKVWDVVTGQELLSLIGHYNLVHSVSFSADGKRLASGGYDQTVKIWDATTEQELDILKGHTSQCSSVGFSTDGKRIIAQSFAGNPTDKPELRAWDAVTGAEIVPCTDPPPPPGQLRAVSPDSRMTLVVKGNTVEVHRRTRFTVDREERRQEEERKTLFWHQQQAQEAEQNRQWFAAAFHLDWLIHNGPEQAALLVRRSSVRRQQGRRAEASTDIHRALQLEPKNFNALWSEARLCLASQDHPGYRRACAAFQDALRGNSDSFWTLRLAHTCSLAPDALADWKPLLQRIDKIDKALAKKDWFTSLCLGWVLIRAGRYNDAIPHLQAAYTLRTKNNTSTMYEDRLLALAYHHLGKRDEALSYLRQAEKWREVGQAPVRAAAAVGVGHSGPLMLLSILHSEMADPRLASWFWEERLELQLLYREVHQLLKSPSR